MIRKFFGMFSDIPQVLFVAVVAILTVAIINRTPMLQRITNPSR